MLIASALEHEVPLVRRHYVGLIIHEELWDIRVLLRKHAWNEVDRRDLERRAHDEEQVAVAHVVEDDRFERLWQAFPEKDNIGLEDVNFALGAFRDFLRG